LGFADLGVPVGSAAENKTTAEPKQRSIKIVLNELFLPMITEKGTGGRAYLAIRRISPETSCAAEKSD
jgi:hypothetical protein